MARGHEETSMNGRPGGRTRATPSASSIISSLTMEELMRYYEVPDDISFRLVDKLDESTLSVEHNDVFFTREHLAVGLRFLVPAMVKQFLHFTRAPPALIHLVELFIIYFLNIGSSGRISMSVLSPRVQIVNGLPDSPKTKAKGALLVRGPWDETLGSPRLLFNVNRSQSFPGLLLGRF